jgi:hypothetical protein
MLWQILATLAVVEDGRGNPAVAGELRGRAREIIDYIAAHAGDEELRASFLSQPEVAALREIIDYIAAHAGDEELRASFLSQPEVAALLASNDPG